MVELFTTREVAELLKMNPVTVSRKAARGEIPAVKIGRRFRFDRQEIERWLQNGTNSGKTIMVVDDEETVRMIMKMAIEKMGYRIVTASNGVEALELLSAAKPSLIFLDLSMPGMDGAEVFRRIRASGNYVPIIIITGYPQSKIMEDVLTQGPLSVIKKPFNIDDISRVLAGFLGAGKLPNAK